MTANDAPHGGFTSRELDAVLAAADDETVNDARRGGLTGKELDAVLSAADDELLGYIRARTHPEAALMAMLASGEEDTDAGSARSLRGYRLSPWAGRGKMRQRRARIPVGSRRRKRWTAAAAAAAAATGLWLVILAATGSVLLATAQLLVLAAFAGAYVMAMRWLGVGGGHPWARQLAARPWRDGRDVLNAALRHLSEVFIVMPGKVLLAPNAVELLMNPDDLASLSELIDIELVNSSAAECYEAEVAAHAARLAIDDPVQVSVTSDPAVPAGRYRLRRGQLHVNDYPAGPFYPYVHDSSTWQAPALAATVRSALTTAAEPVLNPPLRLVTDASVTETRVSGARAGRGLEAELQLPGEPTVSRVHATFTFAEGQWWITVRGRNGLLLNGTPLTEEHVVRPGDTIRWGRQDGALMSRVEIGQAEQHSFYAGKSC